MIRKYMLYGDREFGLGVPVLQYEKIWFLLYEGLFSTIKKLNWVKKVLWLRQNEQNVQPRKYLKQLNYNHKKLITTCN